MAHIYSGILLSHKKKFVVRWMDLESVIQSEVSQKEKNKYIYMESKKKKKTVLKNLGTGQE